MKAIRLNQWEDRNFIELVTRKSGQALENCYQCGKCTAGCPIAFACDLMPNQVIRMVQMGLKEEVLHCQSIWLCASCVTCTVRCPRNIDVARVMDTLRIMARHQGISPPGKGRYVALFNENFLGYIQKNGRLFELATMAMFNLKTGQPFREASTGLAMLKRGKLKLTVTKPRGLDEINRIFEKVRQAEKGGKK
ncbi:4Fe-4S dicluster domain-containing protein [Desulfofundulus thermocisternus]|uniref:4Fe-4S dicluster domain-containing protein n=1 Tax=Desulfofundulus thermocisternus TaxID=42471 RepID=UPI00217DF2C4|nr:4Fe-4S dicluster domain-containing protein [Desulfofundulus thermocisternus]MCS5695854.1 4Fe-4S dicluster domain-containing protein [Desulfofundulus thermocisternus]